ncbi:MAG: MgtC/SapB family protein [Candidatus Korobacteraceae bacterium]
MHAYRELAADLPNWWPISSGASSSLLRLIVAAILGGAIGLERELKHRPTGLRTVMFICFGSAMFTLLSERLAGEFTGDHTRIAAQIIPGIGFIGGGAILLITSSCESADPVVAALNRLLDQTGLSMQSIHIGRTDDTHCRLQFTVEAYLSQQETLTKEIKQLPLVMTMAKSTTAERD